MRDRNRDRVRHQEREKRDGRRKREIGLREKKGWMKGWMWEEEYFLLGTVLCRFPWVLMATWIDLEESLYRHKAKILYLGICTLECILSYIGKLFSPT